MANRKEKDGEGCLIFAAIAFGLAALSTALGFVFKGKTFLREFLMRTMKEE